jgi:LysM repeat protein
VARARLLCLSLAWILTVAGCVAPKVSATKDTERPTTAGTSRALRALKRDPVYVVQPGDTLAKIALWTTGDSGNWRAIARHNDIADPTKLKVKQRLRIPAALLEASLRATPQPLAPNDGAAGPGDGPADPATQVRTAPPLAQASPPPAPAPTPKPQVPERPTQKVQGRAPPLAQVTPPPAPAPKPQVPERPTQKVQGPVEQGSQAHDTPAPLAPPPIHTAPEPRDPETRTASARDTEPTAPRAQAHDSPATRPPAPETGWIMVTGSYYPREVKAKPDRAADSLMLVWPGTRLRYVDRQGIWYKVLTDKGEGYVDQDYAREQ